MNKTLRILSLSKLYLANHDGYEHKNGLLFKAGDTEELANQITYLLGKPQVCQRLTENGVQTAKQRFDITVMVKNLEAYFEQIHAKVR